LCFKNTAFASGFQRQAARRTDFGKLPRYDKPHEVIGMGDVGANLLVQAVRYTELGKPLSEKPVGSDRDRRGTLLGSPILFAPCGDSDVWMSELFPHLSRYANQILVRHTRLADVRRQGRSGHRPKVSREALFAKPTAQSSVGFGGNLELQ